MTRYEKIIENLIKIDKADYEAFEKKLTYMPGSEEWKELESVENELEQQARQELEALKKCITWYRQRAKTAEDFELVNELDDTHNKLYEHMVCDLTDEEINDMAEEAAKGILEAYGLDTATLEDNQEEELNADVTDNVVLARKGKYILVKYECGLYSVEIRTKSVGMTVFTSEDKEKAVEYFASVKTRKSKDDFNLEIFSA